MDDEFVDDILDALRPMRIICPPPMDHSLINSCRRCICCRVIVKSEKCRHDDCSQHKARCAEILETMIMINKKLSLLYIRGRSNIEKFVGPYGRGYFDTLSVYAMGEGSEGCWKDYFLLWQKLIEQLIREGIARTDGNGKMKQNELALNIAIFHCRQLFTIDKYDSYYSHVVGLIPRKETLMNLYLFTGRYQELYNLCCFYASKGEHTIHTPYRQGFNNILDKEDIFKSFFDGNIRSIHHASFPAVALNHMYLLKQVMHEIMKVLIWVDSQFLSSHDCVATIGEFLGLDREWISFEKDWYKNQAREEVVAD